MTTALATAAPKKERSYSEVIREQDSGLLKCAFTLEEFSKHIEVSYDDRWKNAHEWRVRGDQELYYWIHDVRQSRDEEKLSETQVIEKAYARLQKIKLRNGQMNFNGVYLQETVIEIIPRKTMEYAKVRIVQDCVDKQWRWTYDYWVGSGGGSGPLTLEGRIVSSEDDAILSGARYLKKIVVESYSYREGDQGHKTYANKIEKFIESIEAQIRQPSLFC